MPYEEDGEVYQRIQEMFQVNPQFRGKSKVPISPKKVKKTKATIKKAMIEEPKKGESKGLGGLIIVGIGFVILAICAYIYFKH